MNTYHIYHNDQPYTYIVFGPYANGTEWDVEVHRGHVNDNRDESTYMDTKTIDRDTHIVADMWDAMDSILASATL